MNDKKKLTYIIVAICITLTIILANLIMPNSKVTENLEKVQTELVKEIIVSEETKSEVADTKNAVANGGDVSTTEIAKASIKEEQEVTDEGADESLLEKDALVEQENIAYNGDNAGKGLSLLGKWQGLTYYSQADSRWASKPYTSIGDKTQTMKSSACGPTSAAMVVSSAKGAILPTTMASLFVDNGYRTANSGTAWSAYSFVADYFGFNEYHKTDNFNTAMTYLSQKNEIGTSKYYIICSCGSGLFTTGGHYIVLAGLKGDTIQVFDPYLYNGKFNTASRKSANVKVDGTSAYVSKANFLKYSNYKSFWIYSNDKGNAQKKEQPKKTEPKKEQKKEEKKPIKKEAKKKEKVKNTVGKKKTLKVKCYLYKNKTLTGTKYTYKKNTKVKVLKNTSSKVDYVQVIATGRKAYIKISNYK